MEFPENLAVFSAAPTHTGFYSRYYGYLSSWSWNPGLCGLAWGWNCSLPRYPSKFLSTTCVCGTTYSATAASPHHTTALCPSACLHVSASPTHLDECGFFKSLIVRLPYFLIFLMVLGVIVLRSSCNSFCGCMRR